MTKVAALVPIRHHSERVPGKNYRLFAGEPLCCHIVSSLVQCTQITAIAIDTDSPAVREAVGSCFPQVHFIDRPAHLRDGSTPMNDVLLHDVQQLEADFYLQTHTTNPLLRSETIDRALSMFLANYPVYDSLFTVTRLQSRLWDQLARPVNHNAAMLLRTQDLPPIYEENSNMYIFTGEALRRRHNRIGDRPMMFEIDRLEAWDIDEELDFTIAEFLFLQRQETNR